MYTVLIVERKMQALMDRCQLLLEPFIGGDNLSVCIWDPDGNSVETAVPELYGLIENKESWQAIVLLDMRERGGANPFDCPENYKYDPDSPGPISEGAEPFIRLSHMLGGFPRKYAVCDDGQGTAPCVEEKYAQGRESLLKQYAFRAKRPELIVLTALCKTPRDGGSRAHRAALEGCSAAADFCERNDYPDRCRFIAFDTHGDTDSIRAREYFEWWCAVLTMAMNPIPPSALQAYKLYRLDVGIDANELCVGLSALMMRMRRAREALELINAPKREEEPNGTLPVIETAMPLSFESFSVGDVQARPHIGLAGDCPDDERLVWDNAVRGVTVNMVKLFKQPRRALMRAVETVHKAAEVDPRGVRSVDRFAREDLDEYLIKCETELAQANTVSGLNNDEYRKAIDDGDKAVRAVMGGRMSKRCAVAAGCVSIAAFLIGWTPFMIAVAKGREGAAGVILAALGAGLMAAALVGALLVLRHKLVRVIASFNSSMARFANKVGGAAQGFSIYLSKAVSFMRGYAVSEMLDRRETYTDDQSLLRRRHLFRVNMTTERCVSWLKGFDLKEASDIRPDPMVFDAELSPDGDPYYRLETAKRGYCVPFNDSGEDMAAPYCFITALTLCREEL